LTGIESFLASFGHEKQQAAQEECLLGPVAMTKYEFPKNV
jgi:hypothetical protein